MKKINIVGLLPILLATPAAADLQEDVRSTNNQVGVQILNRNIGYAETVNGSLLDTENGYVPGYGLSFSLMKDLWLGNDYIQAQYNSFDGKTHYVGGTIGNPTYGSLVSYSSAKIVDFNLRYGKGINMDDGYIQTMLTPYAEIGHHHWDRGVGDGSPGGYPETYTHSYYGIGILSQSSPENRLIVSINALVGKTFGAHIDVAPPAPASFSTELGSSMLYKAGISLDYAFTNHIHANAGVDYTNWKYGKSAIISGYYEPDSETEDITAKIGIGYAF